MEIRQFMRTDVAVSAIAHVSLLAMIFLFSDVHPFGVVTAEPIAVDIVTADEVPEKPTPEPKPELKSDLKSEPASQPEPDTTPQLPTPDKSSAAQPAAAAAPQAPTPRSQPKSARPDRREAMAQPQAQAKAQQPPPSPAATPPPPPAPASSQGYTPPEPDLTVKYHVMLGLPEALPPVASSGDKPGDGVDATASHAADIDSDLIAAFRRHLKTCSKLPNAVTASDNVMIKLRVLMTPQARLAADPILIQGTASMKGLALKQSAERALAACQPYDMLPVDRYGEWKVLDLSFTPQDFTS